MQARRIGEALLLWGTFCTDSGSALRLVISIDRRLSCDAEEATTNVRLRGGAIEPARAVQSGGAVKSRRAPRSVRSRVAEALRILGRTAARRRSLARYDEERAGLRASCAYQEPRKPNPQLGIPRYRVLTWTTGNGYCLSTQRFGCNSMPCYRVPGVAPFLT